MAPSNTPDGQPYPARRSMNGDGLETIGTTGRLEPAPRPQQRADECAVEPDEREQQAGDQPASGQVGLPRHLGRGRMLRCHDRPSVGVRASDPRRRSKRLSATSSSAARCSLRADAAGGLARTTKRLPLGSIGRRLRMRCLNLRLTWFRTTAPPTALLTTKPTSGGSSASRRFRCATRAGRPARRPRRIASANSSPRRMRDADGSTGPSSTYGRPLVPGAARGTGHERAATGRQTVSSARPLRRRAARMARPARVRMRSRKPWVFARRRLFGW